MKLPWARRLAIPVAVAAGLGVGVAGPAQADTRVSFTCEYVSPVFYMPMGSFAFAQGCTGPVGQHTHAFFKNVSPAAADYCARASAYQVAGSEGLHVSGWDCLI
jgi:hypothetical protein